MKQVYILTFALGGESAFYKGSCFEEALLMGLESSKKHYSEEGWHKLLISEIENLKDRYHPQDLLDDLFSEDVFIDYDFAIKLNLYDVLSINCFYAKNETGKAMIKLIEYAGFRFIVRSREWCGKESFYLDLDVCHKDCVDDIRNKHIRCEF